MGSIPAWMLVHTVIIEPRLGISGHGPTYGPPEEHDCLIDDVEKLDRAARDQEALDPVEFWLVPGAVVPVGSRVTIRGRIATALKVATRDGGGLPTPDHVQVTAE